MRIRSAAGQAHWQAGYTEKQGGIWKAIFSKINDEHTVTKEDIGVVREEQPGEDLRLQPLSARVRIITSDARGPAEWTSSEPSGDEPVIDDKHAREVALRTAARAAYHHVQTDERVGRALLGQTRVQKRLPEVGERVSFYRKTRNNKRGLWHGPATVIGKEGNNVWVTKNGRCLLCAPEHLRLATGEELGEMFAIRAAREYLDKLLNADQEDEGVYGDQEEGDLEMINAEGPEMADCLPGQEPWPQTRRPQCAVEAKGEVGGGRAYGPRPEQRDDSNRLAYGVPGRFDNGVPNLRITRMESGRRRHSGSLPQRAVPETGAVHGPTTWRCRRTSSGPVDPHPDGGLRLVGKSSDVVRSL